MATKTKPKRMTAEQFFLWATKPQNAGGSYELNRGEVVEVPPPQHSHGVYCWLVSKVLTAYLTRRGEGYICTNDTGIIVERKPDTVRGADLMLFLESPEGGKLKKGYVEDIPTLIVEVLSPDDRPGRTMLRVEQYINRGIPMVWLLDQEERLVTVYRPNEFHKVLDETETITGNGVLPNFTCRVSELFAVPVRKPPSKSPRRPRKGTRE